MYRLLILALLFAGVTNAQTKKPAPATSKTKPGAVKKDSVKKEEPVVLEEVPIPKEFAVYTKKPRTKAEKMKLCVNLVSPENIFNYCYTDSICRDPEVSKILFEKKQGDSTYVLVYVRAFSKPADKPSCDAGKEVKLFFIRWHTASNKAVVKAKTVESCMKAITNMTKESIDSWDGASPLVFKYHKGGQNYVETKFDPQNYLLGLQSANDN
jgi:hypothetical protein